MERKELNKIINVELLISDKKRILSPSALKSFIKISDMKGPNAIVFIKSAITEYKKGDRIMSYSINKIKENQKVLNDEYIQSQNDINEIDIQDENGDNKSSILNVLTIKTSYGDNLSITPGDAFIDEKFINFNDCIKYYRKSVGKVIDSMLKKFGVFKVKILADITVVNDKNETILIEKKLVYYIDSKTKSKIIRNLDDKNEFLNNYEKNFGKGFTETMEHLRGSGWSYFGCNNIKINIYKMKSSYGSSYIKSPDYLGRGIINIKNEDDLCFKYCIKYHKSNKNEHDARVSALKKINDDCNYDDLNFPLKVDDIEIFERNNKTIAVNCFKFDSSKRLSLIYEANNKTDNVVNLLLLEDEDKAHYTYIKNMGTIIKNETVEGRNQRCEKCLQMFDKRYDHKCSIVDQVNTKIKYDENGVIEFKNYKNFISKPFVCYFDFESFINKKTGKHDVNSYAYKIICSFDKKYNSELVLYRGKDAIINFINAVQLEQKKYSKLIYKLNDKFKNHNLSKDEEEYFMNEKKCYVCGKDAINKVRDHCHLTGKFRGVACNDCNLKMIDKNQNRLYCFAHNLNYDGNFILAEASKFTENIEIIATTEEKFMTFSFNSINFLDSYKFLADSLDNLVKNTSETELKHTKEYFKENFKYACKKGIYPYEHVDDFNKFNEVGLPKYNDFYSKLKNSNYEKSEYIEAEKTYNEMKLSNFGEYHDFYLKCDVLLLCDIFENFRKLSLSYFKLDPVHYMSLPSLSYDAFLKSNKIPIKMISNEEIKNFYEDHKIGAICAVMGKKHVKANNKYMGLEYDCNKESNYILYIDANNLYGYAMCKKLPYEIIGKVELSIEELMSTDDIGDIGYTVCCDLSFPKETHDKFNGFAPAPVKRCIDEDELSKFQKKILKDQDIKFHKSEKVILDLHDKKDYKIDFRLLKLYQSLGVKIDKIHYAYKYKMDYIIKEYINMNTAERTKGKSKFEKDFYKLCNNAIYGKMLQDITKQTDVKITRDNNKAMKWFGYPQFKDATFTNGMYQIKCDKKEVLYNRATYIGSTILDLSKLLMYDFHYNYMKKKYKENVELIYTDTDSFVYDIKTDDLYQEMYNDEEYYDLSEVKIDSFISDENIKRPGKFKDETYMKPITEFIALNPKVYSFIVYGDKERHSKAKGVTKSFQILLRHDKYNNTLETNKQEDVVQMRIMMFRRHVYTLECNKVALSNFDDKMYRTSNYEALSYGHKMIKNNENQLLISSS